MEEITVPSFRVALRKGKAVPGKPHLLVGEQIGTSMYTWNHIYDLKACTQHNDEGGQCQRGHGEEHSSGLALKASSARLSSLE